MASRHSSVHLTDIPEEDRLRSFTKQRLVIVIPTIKDRLFRQFWEDITHIGLESDESTLDTLKSSYGCDELRLRGEYEDIILLDRPRIFLLRRHSSKVLVEGACKANLAHLSPAFFGVFLV